ncbi:type II toxin-antitoxin system ParD family antitoxin [Streptosporangium sp. NPDC001559]|uniref:ribbon-helix-helix domain-containing protein n=1 Tax=Streptosporangium sp. NPDC001559 TaxID=3366187 RepID=UPI0036E143A9
MENETQAFAPVTVSVTLAPQDAAFVEAYVTQGRAPSRSAALREALRLLRASADGLPPPVVPSRNGRVEIADVESSPVGDLPSGPRTR